MLFKNLIWIAKIVGTSDQGREAIYYSVPLPTQARFVMGHGIINGFPTLIISSSPKDSLD
jgi:hypothetical protein